MSELLQSLSVRHCIRMILLMIWLISVWLSHEQAYYAKGGKKSCNFVLLLHLLLPQGVIGASHNGESGSHLNTVHQTVDKLTIPIPGKQFAVHAILRQVIEGIYKAKDGSIEWSCHYISSKISSSIFNSVDLVSYRVHDLIILYSRQVWFQSGS